MPDINIYIQEHTYQTAKKNRSQSKASFSIAGYNPRCDNFFKMLRTYKRPVRLPSEKELITILLIIPVRRFNFSGISVWVSSIHRVFQSEQLMAVVSNNRTIYNKTCFVTDGGSQIWVIFIQFLIKKDFEVIKCAVLKLNALLICLQLF